MAAGMGRTEARGRRGFGGVAEQAAGARACLLNRGHDGIVKEEMRWAEVGLALLQCVVGALGGEPNQVCGC